MSITFVEKEPSAVGVRATSRSSDETIMVAFGSVFPSTVIVSIFVTLSSSGAVRESDKTDLGLSEVEGASVEIAISFEIGFLKEADNLIFLMFVARNPKPSPINSPISPAINISFFALSIAMIIYPLTILSRNVFQCTMRIMDIYPLGHSSFRIKGKSASIVMDPFDPNAVGLKFPKVDADIVTISHDHKDHNSAILVEGNPYVVSGPGEYEIKGVHILGVSVFHDDKMGAERGKNVMYQYIIDGLTLVHLGDLGHKLTSEQAKEIGTCDILFIPVGGNYTIGSDIASEVSAQFEPKIIIPMHFKKPGLKPDFDDLDGVDKFLKEMGKEEVTPTAKLSITKDKLPEDTEVVVLE